MAECTKKSSTEEMMLNGSMGTFERMQRNDRPDRNCNYFVVLGDHIENELDCWLRDVSYRILTEHGNNFAWTLHNVVSGEMKIHKQLNCLEILVQQGDQGSVQ